RDQVLRGPDRRVQAWTRVFVVDGPPVFRGSFGKAPRFFGRAQRTHEAVELSEDSGCRVGGGTGRGNSIQQAVEFVVLENGGLVESLDECAPVITRRHDAVVFE